MTILTTTPFSDVLTDLTARADAADGALRTRFMATSDAERGSLMQRARDEHQAFYLGFARSEFLAVSPGTRRLLYALARTARATSVVEFGTSFGVSTLHLAAAVHDNGGGRVVTAELEPGKASAARDTFIRAGVAHLVDVREGDATETLRERLPDVIDLVLLDGAKPLYLPVLALLEARLRPGALVIADNADDAPDYAAHVKGPGSGYVSVRLEEDVELSVRER